MSFADLEALLEVQFQNPALLEAAFTHPSWTHDHPTWTGLDQTRLSFLGDSLLQAGVAHLLFQCRPHTRVERLVELRLLLSSSSRLADYARERGLGRYVRLGRGELSVGVRDRDGLLAEAFTALVAAIFFDQGFQGVLKVVLPLVRPALERPGDWTASKNPKSELQQLLSQHGLKLPEFREIDSWGPPHEPSFKVGLYVDRELMGQGEGRNKKQAEAEAARKVLRKLRLELHVSAQEAEAQLKPGNSSDARATQAPEGLPTKLPIVDVHAGQSSLDEALEALIEAVERDVPLLEPAVLERASETRRRAGSDAGPFVDSADELELPGPRVGQADAIDALANPKGVLQEFLHQRGEGLPEYRLVASEGPAHAPLFRISVFVDERRCGEGAGQTRRLAEQEAARACLRKRRWTPWLRPAGLLLGDDDAT